MKKQDTLLSDIFLQPWFLPQKAAHAIRAKLPSYHRHKMRFYFEDYGCLKCGKRNTRYGANAMCKACEASVKLKMLLAIRRRWRKAGFVEAGTRTFKRMADAQAMLKDLASLTQNLTRKRRVC